MSDLDGKDESGPGRLGLEDDPRRRLSPDDRGGLEVREEKAEESDPKREIRASGE